ncbi:MAG: RMD1 family protein [Desulfobacteraceae bacterium]|nr:MAG: RMD1 family protein [Desulfobacteraceae bacterium]
MTSASFPSVFGVCALQLAQRFDLKRMTTEAQLSAVPMTYRVGEGLVVVFRYGAVVFFAVAEDVRDRFVDNILLPVADQPLARIEREFLDIQTGPDRPEGFAAGGICLASASLERLQLVAEVLAKSVLLASYETRIGLSFDLVEPVVRALESPRMRGTKAAELLRIIGSSLLIEHAMIGRAEVGETPELLWERPELEGLFRLLEDEFEIRERNAALSRKLDLLSRTAQTALGLLHNRRSLRVEWYIVLLIVAEIGLTLLELFVLRH